MRYEFSDFAPFKKEKAPFLIKKGLFYNVLDDETELVGVDLLTRVVGFNALTTFLRIFENVFRAFDF